MSEKVRKHIIFYGRVQGVGFRYYSVYKSRQLGLTGWVRNLYGSSGRTAGYRSVNCFSSKSEIYNDRRYGH